MDPKSAPASEFFPEFVRGMRDRMAMSYHKYGPVRQGFPDKVDAMSSMEQRVLEYQRTGNSEFLIDAANFLMIEFMLPRHPKAHFRPTDSHESPGRVAFDPAAAKDAPNSDLKRIGQLMDDLA